MERQSDSELSKCLRRADAGELVKIFQNGRVYYVVTKETAKLLGGVKK